MIAANTILAHKQQQYALAIICRLACLINNQANCCFFAIFTPPSLGSAGYCDDRVCERARACARACVCVCLSTIISPEMHVRSSPTFCACYLWPWLRPPLAAS